MKIKTVSVLAFAVSCLVAIVQAQQVVSYYADIPGVSPGAPETLQLPKFDSSLGELTEVKLNFTGEIWQSVYGENMNSSGASYDFASAARLNFTRDDGLTVFMSPSFNLKRQGTAGAFDGNVNFEGASGLHFEQNVTTNGIYIDPQLAHYIGVGNIDFKAVFASTAFQNANANFAKGSSAAGAAGLSVDYSFVPLAAIPEPATYAVVMGVIFAMAGAVFKRRKAIPV